MGPLILFILGSGRLLSARASALFHLGQPRGRPAPASFGLLQTLEASDGGVQIRQLAPELRQDFFQIHEL
jgi:hypothetical protein